MGDYFPELGLIFLRNGIHHPAVVSILAPENDGTALCEAYHLADAYPHLDLDEGFQNWVLADGQMIPVKEPRFALMYKIAKELCL